MPKKKPPFFYFMCEVREREEKSGKKMTMEQVSKYAGPLWEALSATEKDKYKAMSKEKRTLIIELPQRPKFPDANSFRTELDSEVIYDIKKMICENFESETLDILPIYFIAFNIHCSDGELLIPREVGIVSYTIKNGIESTYHAFIKPFTPLGLANEAKENASVHGIPSIDFNDDIADYRQVSDEIIDFISQNGDPIVFCLDSSMNTNIKCIKWLSNKISRHSTTHLDRMCFYPASVLLMELRAIVGKPFISQSTVLDILQQTSFDYTHSIRCEFHQEIDNPVCALAASKKLAYFYSSELHQFFDVSLTPNHLPPQNEIAASIMQLKFPEIKRNMKQTPLPQNLQASEGVSEKFSELVLNTRPPPQPREVNLALERAKQTCGVAGRGRGLSASQPTSRPGSALEEFDAPNKPPAL